MVRDDLIVTAAHCLSSEKITKAVPFSRLQRSFSDEFDSEKFGESEFLLFPEYKYIGGFATVGTDIAFIVYPKGTLSGFTQAKFSKVPAKSGDVISMVGYGDTAFKDDDSNPQLKRFRGQNVIANIDPEYSNAILSDTSVIGFTTAGLGQGDSGGPLFNTDGEIVGISKGNMLDLPETADRPSNSYVSDKNKLYSVYLNIAEPNVAAFIASIMRDPRPSKAKLEGITHHPLQESPFSPAVAKCEGNGFCKDGWGWLASGEANCKVGAPGWIPEKNGCSCTCN